MTRFTIGGKFSTHPVVLRVSPEDTGTTELAIPLTLKAAKQLRLQLSDAIEWGVNMADLYKESNAANEPRSNSK